MADEMNALKAIRGLRYIDSMSTTDLFVLLANGATLAGNRTIALYNSNIKLFYDTHSSDVYSDTYKHYGFMTYKDLCEDGSIYDLLKAYKDSNVNPVVIPHGVIMTDHEGIVNRKDNSDNHNINIIYVNQRVSLVRDDDVVRSLEHLIGSLTNLYNIHIAHA